jgi:hypothetical protein
MQPMPATQPRRRTTAKRKKPMRKRRGAVRRFFRRLGFRADGGPVLPGRPYVVGERGPEILRVSAPGRIESVPGGNGRTAAVSRAPTRGFAGLSKARRSLGRTGTQAIVSLLAGGGAVAIGSLLDRMGIKWSVQGGIFGGLALVLGIGAAIAKAPLVGAAAVGFGVASIYELVNAGFEWFRTKYPELLGSKTPAPTKPPAA